jgi:predicted ATP-binding protein involved in virulence
MAPRTKRMNKSIKKTIKHHNRDFCCNATFHGLNKWYAHMFEELGWMVLAQHRGINEKVMVYKHSVQRLKESIEHKMHEIKDGDKKEDLKIMHENVCVLMAHVNKDF